MCWLIVTILYATLTKHFSDIPCFILLRYLTLKLHGYASKNCFNATSLFREIHDQIRCAHLFHHLLLNKSTFDLQNEGLQFSFTQSCFICSNLLVHPGYFNSFYRTYEHLRRLFRQNKLRWRSLHCIVVILVFQVLLHKILNFGSFWCKTILSY